MCSLLSLSDVTKLTACIQPELVKKTVGLIKMQHGRRVQGKRTSHRHKGAANTKGTEWSGGRIATCQHLILLL